MDPGEFGFMAEEDFEDSDEVEDAFDDIEEESELEDGEIVYIPEDDFGIEMEEFAALGVVIGLAHQEMEQKKVEKSDEEIDRAIDEMAASTRGYCRMKGLWYDNPDLARSLYRKIYEKD